MATKRNDIRGALIARGVSLTALGSDLGLSRQRVAAGIDDPKPWNARRIKARVARALHTTIDVLWPDTTGDEVRP